MVGQQEPNDAKPPEREGDQSPDADDLEEVSDAGSATGTSLPDPLIAHGTQTAFPDHEDVSDPTLVRADPVLESPNTIDGSPKGRLSDTGQETPDSSMVVNSATESPPGSDPPRENLGQTSGEESIVDSPISPMGASHYPGQAEDDEATQSGDLSELGIHQEAEPVPLAPDDKSQEQVSPGFGSWTTGQGDTLYFLSSRDNLRLILAQGYVGPIFNRQIYSPDFLVRKPGFVLLLPGPIGVDMVGSIEHGEFDTPFVLEIPAENINPNDGSRSLDRYGISEPWNSQRAEVVAVAIPGAIPVSAIKSVVTRSEEEKRQLLQSENAPGEANVRYRDLPVIVDKSLFSGQASDADKILEWLVGLPANDANLLTSVDTALDRLTGGISLSLWLLALEPLDDEPLDMFKSWLETVFSASVTDTQSLNTLISKLYDVSPSSKSDTQSVADRWIFEQVSQIILADPAERAGNRYEFLPQLADRAAKSNLPYDTTGALQRAFHRIEEHFMPDGPMFDGFKEGPTALNSSKPLLIAMLSQNSAGLRINASMESLDSLDLAVAAFWVGSMTGRRDTSREFRNDNLDTLLADWISHQLSASCNQSGDGKAALPLPINLQRDDSTVGETTVHLDVDGREVFQRRYKKMLTPLIELFTDKNIEDEASQKAALYLCESMGWVDDCIETRIRFRSGNFDKHERLTARQSELTIRGVPEFSSSVNMNQLLKKLETISAEVPNDVLQQVHQLLAQSTIHDNQEKG